MNSVNFFKISKVPEIIENTIFSELADILDPEDESLIAIYPWKDGDIMFTFLSDQKVKSLVILFEAHAVLEKFKNVTESILMAREKGKEFKTVFENTDYTKLLNKFLKENLTVDLILDKITEYGIESINEIDKEIMKNY